MSDGNSKRMNKAVLVRGARIVSGLFLLAFITTHLVNMILGLHSITLMDEMRPYLTGIWTGAIGSKLLMAVLFTHFILALEAIYKRETLRMSANDMVQFGAGLLIIPLLLPHALGIGAMREISSEASYSVLLNFFWLHDPIAGLRQVLLIGIIWVHGCLGLFVWMRSKQWSIRVLPWLYPLAVAVPVMALLGYVEAGRDILIASKAVKETQYLKPDIKGYGAAVSSAEKMYATTVEPVVKKDADAIITQSKVMTSWIIWISTGMILLTLLARFLRVSRHAKRQVEIDYVNGPLIKTRSGLSMLDIARHNDLPHANICHGRGRCGTCQVLVLSSSEELPAPSELEQQTLDRLNLGVGVRLACQLNPKGGHLRVEQILPADYILDDIPSEPSAQEEVT